jgi:hypothetical protein
MDITRAERAIDVLNQDFNRLPVEQLYEIEDALELSSGQVSARRYTLPGDTQRVREEIRQQLLAEADAEASYLAPESAFPPEAVRTTPAALTALVADLRALAARIRR